MLSKTEFEKYLPVTSLNHRFCQYQIERGDQLKGKNMEFVCVFPSRMAESHTFSDRSTMRLNIFLGPHWGGWNYSVFTCLSPESHICLSVSGSIRQHRLFGAQITLPGLGWSSSSAPTVKWIWSPWSELLPLGILSSFHWVCCHLKVNPNM